MTKTLIRSASPRDWKWHPFVRGFRFALLGFFSTVFFIPGAAPNQAVWAQTLLPIATPSDSASARSHTQKDTSQLTDAPQRKITTTPENVPPRAGSNEKGGCEDHTMHSDALNLDLWYAIYLPPGYGDASSEQRYPVVYLLSGLGGNYREWAYDYDLCGQVENLSKNNEIQPMIIVMLSGNVNNPQAGYGGYWFNHAPEGFACPAAIPEMRLSDGRRWGDYIWHDLVNYVDANYRTLPQASSRAIGGMSAGGQAALTHALMHPDTFGLVGAHSPSQRQADCSIAYYGDSDFYKQYDPLELAQVTSATANLAIWLDEADHSVWYTDNEAFHSLLTVMGVEHEWHVYPGEHNPPYWHDHSGLSQMVFGASRPGMKPAP